MPTDTLPLQGLSVQEVEASRREHGVNILTPPAREPWWKLWLEKFDDPVIRILIIAAVIATTVGVIDGKYAEGIGIIIAILLATTLAFLNEYQAAKEFDILNRTNDDVPVKVLRAGVFTTVPRRDLVVGDIVHLEVGEEVPADGVVLEAVAFQINEARLSGEFKPVDKFSRDHATPPGEALAYPRHMVLRGTIVVDGYATVQITAVGDATEIGQTARAAAEAVSEESPLTRQLEGLSKLIGVVGLGVASFTFAALILRGLLVGELKLSPSQWYFSGILGLAVAIALVRVWLPIVYDAAELARVPLKRPKWLEGDNLLGWLKTVLASVLVGAAGLGAGVLAGMLPASAAEWLPAEVGHQFLTYFMIAVTIIVVAVPEGLAMSVTLSLAYSMRQMTASNNLVRRMHACETIGAATVICSDKTGTITMNEMRVHAVSFPGLEGETTAALAGTIPPLVVEAICANTTAHLARAEGQPTRPLGNPTEGALLLWLEAQGVDYLPHRRAFEIIQQWTFTTDRKFMGTLGRSAMLGGEVLYVKGAPEIVLGRCSQVANPSGLVPVEQQRTELDGDLRSYQARGMRTLAIAYKPAQASQASQDIEQLAFELIWLGFVAIADPVRAEVPEAVQACRRAGVLVKVITGDNVQTSLEVARQIGLWDKGDPPDHAVLGADFARMDDAAARATALRVKVMARARPSDKLRLVRLLQEQDHIVAVTGDGVNDGPALNYANIGLAMGKTGTAVAKEASDIILLDDSFKSIVNAIMWGRSLYENIQRFLLFQLTINLTALCLAMLGPFIGVKLPLTVMQMLWINLIMDTFAALALATEPPSWKVMDRKPRDPRAFIITRPMARGILVSGGAFLVILISLVLWLQSLGLLPADDEPSRGGTILFTVFVLLQFWNLFNARCLGSNRSAFSGLLQNRAFLVIALAILVGQFVLVTFLGGVFRTEPLPWLDWLAILAGTSVVLWVGEAVRWLRRRGEAGPVPAPA